MYGQNSGGYGLAGIFERIFGGQRQSYPRYDAIRAREAAAERDLNSQIAGDTNPQNPVVANPYDQWGPSGRPPLMNGGAPGGGSGVPRPQEDPLDRFERMARLMEIGERVGAAFDKQPFQTISPGGGVAQPQLPQSSQYGLGILRGQR
jgi:hypothetical protein